VRNPTAPRLAYRDDACAVGLSGRLQINRWYGVPNAGSMRAMHELLREHVVSIPGGRMGTIAAIEPSVSLRLDDGTRRAANDLQGFMGDHNIAVAHVVLGSGMMQSIARTIAAGIQMFSRKQHPSEIFKEWEPGFAWVADHMARELPDFDREDALARFVELERLTRPPSAQP
jgi:hypothetical protein